MELEQNMIDRHLLGDIALAMVLVLPTAALAGAELPQRPASQSSVSPTVAKAVPAERSMNERGVGLLG
jgi:hypothetical protein